MNLVKIPIAFNCQMAYTISSLRYSLLCQVVAMEALPVVDALLPLNRIFIQETKASFEKRTPLVKEAFYYA